MHRGRYSKAPPFVWRNDSKAILGVRQDTMRPSGFALGPLSPIEIPNDGEPHPLPLLKDVAGGLDGMTMLGNRGLGLRTEEHTHEIPPHQRKIIRLLWFKKKKT